MNCVGATLREVAAHRKWSIVALHVLCNHVHVVVSTPDDVAPEKVMNDFKSWATRRLREQNLMPPNASVWSHHGSTRYLNSIEAVEAACDYVLNQQNTNPERERRAEA
jgi:REP element-mobilizing transposase RayT